MEGMRFLPEEELLKIRMDCLFTYENDRMVYVNEPWGCTAKAPLLLAGRTAGGIIEYRFGQRAGEDFIEKAKRLLSRNICDISSYMKELGGDCLRDICFYYPPASVSDEGDSCRLLTEKDADILSACFGEGAEEIAAAQPYAGYFCGGRIVSICRSVRKGRGHEAGIETLSEYRRRGCAMSALNVWTSAVLRQGFIPLYSTEPENTASIKLAQKAGYVRYAESFEIM